METTPRDALAMIEACRDELVPRRFVQTERDILSDPARFARLEGIMGSVLDTLPHVP
jgi:hypothetical protein